MIPKIIPLSDLHIGHKDCLEKFKHIVNNLLTKINKTEEHVIVITGDIVNVADHENYEHAKIEINKLRNSGFKVLTAPGNHDYYKILNLSLADKNNVKKFKETFYGSSDWVYPRLDIVGEIAFVALDSMEEELGFLDKFGADGEFGEDQLDRLESLLHELENMEHAKYVVLYFHHHAFIQKGYFHALKDVDRLEKVLNNFEIDAILYGHNHDGLVDNGKWGIPRCYDAGSSTRKNSSDKCHHRFIDLTKNPSKDIDLNLLEGYK